MSVMCLQAQQDCGAVDCPGRCGRYVDGNGDGFCDHGRLSAPQPEAAKPAETAKTEQSKPTPTKVKDDKKQSVEPTTATAPETQTEAETETTETEVSVPAATAAEESEVTEEPKSEAKSPYPVYPICGGLIVLYLISVLLVKRDVWQKATHRKVWNIALTVTFLVSCLLGLLLAFFIHHGYYPTTYVDFLHIHVWFGIGMTMIAVFHLLWHLNYYKAIFKSRKQEAGSRKQEAES